MSYLRIEFHVRLVPRVRMRLYVVVWIVALKDVYGSQNVKSDLRHRCLNVNISRNHLAVSSRVNRLVLLGYFFEALGKFICPNSSPNVGDFFKGQKSYVVCRHFLRTNII